MPPTTNGRLLPDLQQMRFLAGMIQGSSWAVVGLSVVAERRRMAGNAMLRAESWLFALSRREDGQALVEYALLIMMVAVAAIAAVRVFGVDVSRLYQSVIDVYP